MGSWEFRVQRVWSFRPLVLFSKDSDSVLSCSMFRLQNISLGFKPKEGDQVIIQGKLSIWHKTGRFQLIANKMELAGFGELLRKYELLKNNLKTKGCLPKNYRSFASNYKQGSNCNLCTWCCIKRYISTLNRRAPHIQIFVSLVGCKVTVHQNHKVALKELKVYNRQKSLTWFSFKRRWIYRGPMEL